MANTFDSYVSFQRQNNRVTERRENKEQVKENWMTIKKKSLIDRKTGNYCLIIFHYVFKLR